MRVQVKKRLIKECPDCGGKFAMYSEAAEEIQQVLGDAGRRLEKELERFGVHIRITVEFKNKLFSVGTIDPDKC
jgi:transcriptional regulator NrdR family protein